jgi:hypothetical protein
MIMAWYRNRIRIGRRDRFWLTIAVMVVAILFALRMVSRDGFSDADKPVWKSARLLTYPPGHCPSDLNMVGLEREFVHG